jgi:hypothetical protein
VENQSKVGTKKALLTWMLKKGSERKHSLSKNFLLRDRWFRGGTNRLGAFLSGLAALALVGCAGSIAGLHAQFSYDGEALPAQKTAAVSASGEVRNSGDNLIADLPQK